MWDNPAPPNRRSGTPARLLRRAGVPVRLTGKGCPRAGASLNDIAEIALVAATLLAARSEALPRLCSAADSRPARVRFDLDRRAGAVAATDRVSRTVSRSVAGRASASRPLSVAGTIGRHRDRRNISGAETRCRRSLRVETDGHRSRTASTTERAAREVGFNRGEHSESGHRIATSNSDCRMAYSWQLATGHDQSARARTASGRVACPARPLSNFDGRGAWPAVARWSRGIGSAWPRSRRRFADQRSHHSARAGRAGGRWIGLGTPAAVHVSHDPRGGSLRRIGPRTNFGGTASVERERLVRAGLLALASARRTSAVCGRRRTGESRGSSNATDQRRARMGARCTGLAGGNSVALDGDQSRCATEFAA